MNKVASYKNTIYKIAKSRDSDTETRLWRDRILPEMGRKTRRLPADLLTDLTIGAVSGKYGAKAGAKAGKAIANNKKVRKLSSRALKRVSGTPLSRLKGESIGKFTGAAIATGATTIPIKYHIRNKQEQKDYNKLSNKYLGRDINNKEKEAIRTRNKKITLGYGSPVEGLKSTPEAMIQKARRNKK